MGGLLRLDQAHMELVQRPSWRLLSGLGVHPCRQQLPNGQLQCLELYFKQGRKLVCRGAWKEGLKVRDLNKSSKCVA